MILIVSYSGAIGGAERLLLDIAPALGGERLLACPEGPLASAARDAGLNVLALPSRSLRARGGAGATRRAALNLAAHARELRGLVSSLDPELVLAWGMRSAIAALIGPDLRRPVAFQHNDLPDGAAIAALVRHASARASVVIAPSRSVADELRAAALVINPGVDVERFDPRRRPDDPPAVLVLGALAGWKRPDLALEVCALARRRVPDLQVRLVGAPLPEDGRALLDALGRRAAAPDLAGAVEMPGAAADPASDLLRAGCLLHCAEREPFGIAVLEALAAGRPVVVAAACGPAEIVDGSCGFLFAPGDAAAAADAIVAIAQDRELASRLGAAGRRRASRRFGLDRARAEYSRALASLVPAREPARPPSCAVVTVTHNSAGDVSKLLDSVARHLPGASAIVVDCASEDDSVAVAQQRATTIALPENVGFGRASNRGVAEVSEPVTILLNPDVELIDDSLAALAREALDGERLLAPLIVSPDGTREQSVHPPPTSAADLLRSLVPPAAWAGRAGTPLAPWRSRVPRKVGWAVGAALVAPTGTLRALGPFDERIFLYGEDLDLGLRAAAAGIETWFWPAARVLHRGAHSSARAFGGEPFERLAAARHDVVERRLGACRARLDDAAQAVTFASRLALKRALGRPASRERAQLRALSRRSRPAGSPPPPARPA